MKKINITLLILLLILCTLSHAYAYDSLWDRIKDTEGQQEIILSGSAGNGSSALDNPVIKLTNEGDNYRKEGTFTINSFDVNGADDESTQTLEQLISGLNVSYSDQKGDVPALSFRIDLGGKELLSYNGQKTTPYFVSSNFFGDKTYMVFPEDQFEEKIVSAFYKMVESFSGSGSDLPDIEQVYAMIQSIRESGANTSLTSGIPAFNEELDTSAFAPVLMNLLSRFKEAEPEKQNSYLYTDFPHWSRKYTWPETTTLPSFTIPSTAVEAEYTVQDLETLFDALDRFLEANPEYTAFLNQQIQAGFAKSNPELAGKEGVNYLDEMIKEIKPSLMENLNSTVINVKMDLDENGAPVLTTVKITGNNDSSAPASDIIITWHSTKDDVLTVTETAVNINDQNIIQPVFRLLSIVSSDSEGNGTDTLNFIFDIQNDNHLEYAQSTEHYTASTMTRVSDSDIQFTWNKESGSGKIFTSEIPNLFGEFDSTTQISYDHVSNGSPLFSITATSESTTSTPLPAVSPSDAVAASQMDESDYEQIASSIFMQLLMLTMNFN